MWGDKRFKQLELPIEKIYSGEKIMKVSLDAGFTCPNRGRYPQ